MKSRLYALILICVIFNETVIIKTETTDNPASSDSSTPGPASPPGPPSPSGPPSHSGSPPSSDPSTQTESLPQSDIPNSAENQVGVSHVSSNDLKTPSGNAAPNSPADSDTTLETADQGPSQGKHEGPAKPLDEAVETVSESSTLSQPGSSGNETEGSESTSTSSVTTPNKIQIKSALLKDFNGVKVTGLCGAIFDLTLVPHISITVDTDENIIKLRPKFQKLIDEETSTTAGIAKLYNAVHFEENPENLINKCDKENKKDQTFKFVVFYDEEELTLKWKVYDNFATGNTNKEVDVRKFLIKNLDRPFTTIQVHAAKVNEDTILVESKSYYFKSNIPEKCDVIATDCYLNGNVNIEKCFQCTLLVQNNDASNECFKYVSSEITDKFNHIKVNAQDEDDSNEVELKASIDKILEGLYKYGENNKKYLINLDEVDVSLKSELLKFCTLLKNTDSSGALENYTLGNAEDIFTNLTNILKKNTDETKSAIQTKLKNVSICMKNVDEWIQNKKGLQIPTLSHTSEEFTNSTITKEEEGKTVNYNTKIVRAQNSSYDDVINLVSAEERKNYNVIIEDTMYCNDEYCDRWKDDSSCISKIEAEDQGNCATSWLFASKLHLETIKCMKGYDHVPTSALYVANCSHKKGKEKCNTASSPLEFLKILDGEQFLPSSSDMPYSYKLVGDVCPKPKHHWTNLWNNIKLLEPTYKPNSLSAKGYISYQSDKFKNNIDQFINLVKSEVMKKGSVIGYVKSDEVMDYFLNGKKVLNLCGDKTADHALNIIGYGNYINGEGVKKSYWLLRNSWGKYWGDNGNFKVDMHTPVHCQHNFIHTAAVFNLDIPPFETGSKKNSELNNYYLNSSPDFYSNLYYNNFGAKSRGTKISEKDLVGNSLFYGQEDGEKVEPKKEGGDSSELKAGVTPSGEADAAVGQGAQVDAAQKGNDQVSSGNDAAQVAPTQPSDSVASSPSEEQGTPPVTTAFGPVVTPTDPSVRLTSPADTPTDPVVAPTQNDAVQTQHEVHKIAGTHLKNSNKIIQVLHILKHIKHGNVKTGLITYKLNEAMNTEHVCSRSSSNYPEKQEECIKFCDDHWNECKDKISPAYCLTKKRGNNDCFFCYI
ncbi:serine-repeat antigen 4 [Plasmodium gonderi]|uniref:Serine-repeat antigen 4 n=1 Tax=Plasmodium gonderi TaxID=77519 RepID=A0A1Y1JGG9_PLAGO|nr:serine-repeat antigen 4 [Plasmodium gonderi]GAW79533.1 serine-repeat antigen 4 [Plasmodium gonderi]